jgi:ribosomal protein L11 methyltransferase
MNIRVVFPVMLRIESSCNSEAFREDLLKVLLCDRVEAIHEVDHPGLCWDVSFGERATPATGLGGDLEDPAWGFTTGCVQIDTDRWRNTRDLGELRTAAAGRRVLERLGASVRCDLRTAPEWSLGGFEETYGRVQVGRIIVTPPWQIPEVDASTILLKIKPSMGFGTGQHPSTRLALSLLQQVSCEGRDVLDVGTGSGVLAMAAARLGAARVCAIDRDPDALEAAAESLRRNALSKRVELKQADISADRVGEFDVVVANLEAEQIGELGSALISHVRAGGWLIVSGFLAIEREIVVRTLPQVAHFENEADWAAAIVRPVRV